MLDKIGQKANDTAELFFDDVRVPTENLIGIDEGQGFVQLMQQLPQERLIIALQALAVIERALDVTGTYVKERRAFGKQIIEFQNTQFKLAECKTEATVGKVFCHHCVDLHLRGKLDATMASMAKLWLTDTQCKIVDECLQLARRLRLHERIPDSPHVRRQPRAENLRRHERDHEVADRQEFVVVPVGTHRPQSSSPASGGSASRSEVQGEVSDDRLPTREFARSLRRKLTRAETILWSRLRRDQIAGYRFRKQHPIGPYIADFACLIAKLVVEVDGGTHSTDRERAYDRARDAYLRERGWRVCRVSNEERLQKFRRRARNDLCAVARVRAEGRAEMITPNHPRSPILIPRARGKWRVRDSARDTGGSQNLTPPCTSLALGASPARGGEGWAPENLPLRISTKIHQGERP